MGKILKRVHQLCLSHGLHLAVVDVMYKLPESLQSTKRVAPPEDEAEASSGEESESEDEDQDESMTDEESEPMDKSSENAEGIQIDENLVLVSEIDAVVKKIRVICRKIKRSPLKNDTLQKYIRQKHGKELTLYLDCKTRWSSILTMLQRFLRVLDQVEHALLDFKLKHLFPTTDEIELVKKLVQALAYVESSSR